MAKAAMKELRVAMLNVMQNIEFPLVVR